jgi:hypothetical protein
MPQIIRLRSPMHDLERYTFSFVKHFRFLREIDTADLSELHLFGKWEDSDPDQFDFVKANGAVTSVQISPYIVKIDRIKKLLLASNGGAFPLLVRNGFPKFSEFKASLFDVADNFIRTNKMTTTVPQKAGLINKVMGSKYKHGFPVLKKILGGKLWQRLDREICSLCLKIGGSKATSLDYTIIWNNLEEVKDTYLKAPGILPVWLSLTKRSLASINMQGNEYGNEFHIAGAGVSAKSSYKFPNIIATTKRWLEGQNIGPKIRRHPVVPITPRAWKYLTKLNPNFTRKISSVNTKIATFTNTLDILAEIGNVPRMTILSEISSFIIEWSLINDKKRLAVARSIIKHTEKMTGIKHFWENEASLVLDMISHDETFSLDSNQMKAPWSWYMRKQAEWHARIQLTKRNSLKNETWESLVAMFEHKGYTVMPLLSTLDLYDEGKSMKHCVLSYGSHCKDNMSRIFSIRKKNETLATVEVGQEYGFWSMYQIKGKCNAVVDPKLKKIATLIADKYNECQKELHESKELRDAQNC